MLVVKNPPANAGDIRDTGSILGLYKSPEGGPGVSLCSRLLSVLWGLRALQLCTVCCLIPGQVSCEPVSTDLLTLARDSVPHVTTNESRREAGA